MLDLQQFCSEDGARSAKLGQPWSIGDHTYACDGAILVRVDRRTDVPENEFAPDRPLIEKLLGSPPVGQFVAMPPVQLPPFTETECEKCDGRGYEHDCPDCECDCRACDGTGKTQDETLVGIGKAIFKSRYIRRLLALPGLEVPENSASEDPMAFKFEGGIGVLMPCRDIRPAAVTIVLPEMDKTRARALVDQYNASKDPRPLTNEEHKAIDVVLEFDGEYFVEGVSINGIACKMLCPCITRAGSKKHTDELMFFVRVGKVEVAVGK
jgi:hypothetical protein